MEHRCTPRLNVDIKILISKFNIPIAIGRIRNATPSGVFVETEFADIGCEQQLKFEIVVSKNTNHKCAPLEMQALVIHKTELGFGAELAFATESMAGEFSALLNKAECISETGTYRNVANQ